MRRDAEEIKLIKIGLKHLKNFVIGVKMLI